MQGMGDVDDNEKCNNIVEHYYSTSEKLSRLNVFIQKYGCLHQSYLRLFASI